MAKIPFLLELAGIEDNKIDNTFSVIEGIIDLGTKDVARNIRNLTLSELVKGNTNKQQKKENRIDAIIKAINGNDNLYSLFEAEEIVEEMGAELVRKAVDIDNHRWYSIAKDVYEVNDEYFAIIGAYQSFSEMDSFKDVGVHCEAYKVVRVQEKNDIVFKMAQIQPESKKAKEQEDKKDVAKPRKPTTRKPASKARAKAKAKEQEKQQTLLNEEIEL